MQIQVKYCRLSFSDIRKPYVPSDGSAPKFNATGICTDETRLVFSFEGKKYDIPHTDFNKVVVPMLFKEKGWDKVPKVLQNYSYARADESVGSRGPKISSKTEEYYDGYSEETMFVAGSTKAERAPQGILILDGAKNPLEATSGKPVNGDVVTLLMGFYAYEYSGKKGHSASLDGVMYVRKGEHFGAAAAEPSAFDEEELEDELEDAEESAF
jgi:hypothetical protein|tara:strand:- start:447 stop:1082 length:636 start_codon:yes stop_codon:yes gene_type:complete